MTTIDFNREILPICRLVRITPLAGPTIGFNDLDYDIFYESVLYKSMPGFDISAFDASVDLSVNNAQIRVLIQDERITPLMIEQGFFENALVDILIVDYTALTEEPYVMGSGELGQVSGTDTEYSIELMSLENRLDKGRSKKVSIFCEYTFGDSNCGLNLVADGLVFNTTIASKIDDYTYTLAASPSFNASYGKGEFTSGDATNLSFNIFQQGGVQIILYERFPLEPTIGDAVTITAGCQKLPDACKGYGNFVNFGGVPSGGNWVRGRDSVINPLIDRA